MAAAVQPPVQPGETIGILGGGQLGRMIAMAAARLGYKCHIYAPEPDSPAFELAAYHTIARYDDEAALRRFSADVAVVTYEFENVPVKAVELLAQRVPCRPGAKALAICQDRLLEKQLALSCEAETAIHGVVDQIADLKAQLAHVGMPAVLKTRRLGYDGKGQVVIRDLDQAEAAWAAVKSAPCVLEGFVNFSREVSVVAARSLDGVVRAYAVTENEHRDQILHRSVAPASIHPQTARTAIDIAERIGAALDYTGVFAVEFFVAGEGVEERLIVNEMAPRVHNSGHWTLDGCDTSQFEQHVRAVVGLPLGSVALRSRKVEMINLIGEAANRWPDILKEPGAQLHLYGKGEMRPGRKMGHVTRLRE
ncbi:MAG: 5-(carboxyamino)imidazole ribonucleotide synthase [Bosea sp. (in: a-proteobacteria)]